VRAFRPLAELSICPENKSQHLRKKFLEQLEQAI